MAGALPSIDSLPPNLLLLLQVVRGKGDVAPLTRRGLEYSQIADLLREARHLGLVLRNDEGLQLSPEGESLLAASIKRRPPTSPGGWIRPLEEHRVEKISEEDPFLPELAPRVHVLHGATTL